MVRKVYKGLGADIIFLGIKSSFMPYLIGMLVVSGVVGITLGSTLSQVTGPLAFLLLSVLSYAFISTIQDRMDDKALMRKLASFTLPDCIMIRSTIRSLLCK